MTAYFRNAIRSQPRKSNEGLIQALLAAELDGSRLSEDEVIANTIVTMVGGQETTTNLIGNGILTLLHHPDQLAELRGQPALLESAVEELLRFESPSQHTARLAPADTMLGGQQLKQGAGVIAVMAAGNRDPVRFPDPDRLDLWRTDNRHLAFGWAAHFCFGAPLARLEGQIAFATLLRRLPGMALESNRPEWRENLGLRGLTRLGVSFTPPGAPDQAHQAHQ
jgi:cytochrome P450